MDLMQILLLYSFYGICSDMYVYTVYLIYIYILYKCWGGFIPVSLEQMGPCLTHVAGLNGEATEVTQKQLHRQRQLRTWLRHNAPVFLGFVVAWMRRSLEPPKPQRYERAP